MVESNEYTPTPIRIPSRGGMVSKTFIFDCVFYGSRRDYYRVIHQMYTQIPDFQERYRPYLYRFSLPNFIVQEILAFINLEPLFEVKHLSK